MGSGGYRVRIDDWNSLDIFTRQLDLCGVAPDTSCVVLVDPGSDAAISTAAAAAAARLGADVATVRSPIDLGASGSAAEFVRRLVCDVDLVIDATQPGVAEVLRSADDTDQGLVMPKVLSIGGLDRVRLHRLHPHSGLLRRAERAGDRIRSGAVLELTSGHGTDIAVDLTDARVLTHTGVVDDLNPVARWPNGRVSVQPAAGTTTGTLIAMPRDLLVEIDTYVRSPLTVSIRNDHIAEVAGSAGDADLLRSLLSSTGSIDGFGIAELSVGLSMVVGSRTGAQSFAPHGHPRDAIIAAGAISLTFGPNPTADRRGGKPLTIVLNHHSLTIDGRPLVVDDELQGDTRPDLYESAVTPRL